LVSEPQGEESSSGDPTQTGRDPWAFSHVQWRCQLCPSGARNRQAGSSFHAAAVALSSAFGPSQHFCHHPACLPHSPSWER
ncbi:UNVERIFIED_CONTAM: hypothetical protein K2H54_054506, partial [Gekko kuhli]